MRAVATGRRKGGDEPLLKTANYFPNLRGRSRARKRGKYRDEREKLPRDGCKGGRGVGGAGAGVVGGG